MTYTEACLKHKDKFVVIKKVNPDSYDVDEMYKVVAVTSSEKYARAKVKKGCKLVAPLIKHTITAKEIAEMEQRQKIMEAAGRGY